MDDSNIPDTSATDAISGVEQQRSPSRGVLSALLTCAIYVYFIGTMISVPYFNWCYSRDHGFVSWLLFGEIIATAQGAIWPVYALSGGSKRERSTLTSEERAFAEQWNQWVDDHPKEINDLRTRSIANNMTDEEVSREMISLMVRFSNEANIDIPQRFIDELKTAEASPEKRGRKRDGSNY